MTKLIVLPTAAMMLDDYLMESGTCSKVESFKQYGLEVRYTLENGDVIDCWTGTKRIKVNGEWYKS